MLRLLNKESPAVKLQNSCNKYIKGQISKVASTVNPLL